MTGQGLVAFLVTVLLLAAFVAVTELMLLPLIWKIRHHERSKP